MAERHCSMLGVGDHPYKIGWAKLAGLPNGVVWPVEILETNPDSQTSQVYCHSDEAELKVKIKNLMPYRSDLNLENKCIGILTKKNLKGCLQCFKQDLVRIKGLYIALCEQQNGLAEPLLFEVTSTAADQNTSLVNSRDLLLSAEPSTLADQNPSPISSRDPLLSAEPCSVADQNPSSISSRDPLLSAEPCSVADQNPSSISSRDPLLSAEPCSVADQNPSSISSRDPLLPASEQNPTTLSVTSADPFSSVISTTTTDQNPKALTSTDPFSSEISTKTSHQNPKALTSPDPFSSVISTTTTDQNPKALTSTDPFSSVISTKTSHQNPKALTSADPFSSVISTTTTDQNPKALTSTDPFSSVISATTTDQNPKALTSADPFSSVISTTTTDQNPKALTSTDTFSSVISTKTTDQNPKALTSADPFSSVISTTTTDQNPKALTSADPFSSVISTTTTDQNPKALTSTDPFSSVISATTTDQNPKALTSTDPFSSAEPSFSSMVPIPSLPSTNSTMQDVPSPNQSQSAITNCTVGTHDSKDEESDNESCLLEEDSASEYLPDSNPSDEECSDASVEYPLFKDLRYLRGTNPVRNEAEAVTESKALSDKKKQQVNRISSSESNPQSLQNSSECSIKVLGTSNDGRRVYDKRFYCFYCEQPCSKLPRHLELIHKDEIEVAKLLASTDKTERQKMLLKLRNLGNHRHNTEVIRNKSGTLAVSYRQSAVVSWESYVPCEFCLGYFVGSDLWRHIQRCTLAPVNNGKNQKVLQMAKLLLPTPRGTSFGIHKVLSSMKNDEISRCCKGDPLIIKLGEKLYLKHGHDPEQFSYIRNGLRELSRLLLNLRQTAGPVEAKLETFITPKLFKSVVSSARNVAGFSETTHQFQTPSLALKLGHSLKKCAKIMKGEAMQVGDDTKTKQAHSFYELIEMNWTEEVSTHALRTLSENKRNKVKLIPLTNDVMLLTRYLKQQGGNAYASLLDKEDKTTYSQLNEAALAQVILFNRRRQGEVSKMKMEDFLGKHKADQADVMGSLSSLEKKLCETLERIEIVGKRGRTVPVILTTEVKKWIELLMQKRGDVGVHPENTFVFARSFYGSLGHISGCAALRNSSEKCGATHPDLLRSTKLRKQIGTLSQILNLKDHELDILANFLGHDIRVHREFYRLPEETIQVAKVSKLLLSLENGQIGEQKGKTLDEIEIDPEEDIYAEADGESTSDGSDEDEDSPSKGKHKAKLSRKKESHMPMDSFQLNTENQDEDWEPPVKQQRKQHPAKKSPWSEESTDAVMRHFNKHIALSRIPGKAEIEKCQKQEPSLSNRTWRNVKDWVRNKIKTQKSHRIF